MDFDIKSKKNLRKCIYVFWAPFGGFSRKVAFLEILKLKNPCKIPSSL